MFDPAQFFLHYQAAIIIVLLSINLAGYLLRVTVQNIVTIVDGLYLIEHAAIIAYNVLLHSRLPVNAWNRNAEALEPPSASTVTTLLAFLAFLCSTFNGVGLRAVLLTVLLAAALQNHPIIRVHIQSVSITASLYQLLVGPFLMAQPAHIQEAEAMANRPLGLLWTLSSLAGLTMFLHISHTVHPNYHLPVLFFGLPARTPGRMISVLCQGAWVTLAVFCLGLGMGLLPGVVISMFEAFADSLAWSVSCIAYGPSTGSCARNN
ncbi:hypothetical protein CYLTODRAFT_459748 [Cylindrobasidium torrendii FP15055 ss-10]|uniref:Uncharacterized protein n=1 Tax=Cylindrobasidium torrendii FP15055 ss-10 TaxID=1314674 RepID=A0A0D7AWB8_9AGAR|nr:hypothetical protein CYLTODRAFT_459748 [Cylindrobasidium torrendii FP15055 ss-10]